MEIEYGVTTEQANAALRVLRAAGINTEKMAEILQQDNGGHHKSV